MEALRQTDKPLLFVLMQTDTYCASSSETESETIGEVFASQVFQGKQ